MLGTFPGVNAYHEVIEMETEECLQFVDLTPTIIEIAARSGIQDGFLNIQTRHTTTAVIVNENEPLLLQDMKRVLESVAPRDAEYSHNDFDRRTVNIGPEEDQNGHAHCKALFLGTSQILNILDGEIQLGRWQRIFLIELDKPRKRTVSVMILGVSTQRRGDFNPEA